VKNTESDIVTVGHTRRLEDGSRRPCVNVDAFATSTAFCDLDL